MRVIRRWRMRMFIAIETRRMRVTTRRMRMCIAIEMRLRKKLINPNVAGGLFLPV